MGGRKGTGQAELMSGNDTAFKLTGSYDADSAEANMYPGFSCCVENMRLGAIVTYGLGWTLKKVTPVERGAKVFHRLDSSAAHSGAMDKYIEDGLAAAPEILDKLDVFLRDAIEHQEAAKPLVSDEFSKMLSEKSLAIANELQRESIEALWVEYDADGSGDLSLEQVTKLLSDCIAITGKNCEVIMDRKLDLVLKKGVEAAMALAKTSKKDQMRAQNPEVSDNDVEAAFAKQFPPGWMMRSVKVELNCKRVKLLKALSQCLGEMEGDKENLAKKLIEEMDENKDGKVTRDEFTSHFTSAMAHVLNMETLLAKVSDLRL